MKKNATRNSLSRRNLVLRREVIAALTGRQLIRVAGGVAQDMFTGGDHWPCHTSPSPEYE